MQRGARLAGSPADALAYPYRTVDEFAQRVMVDAAEALEVQAALSGLVRAQPRQHRLVPVFELADQIDGQVLAAGREAGQRRIALVAAGVAVVVGTEADDAGPPHRRRLAG